MKRALAVALLVLVALAFAFAFPVTSGGSSGYTTITGNFNDSAGNPLASGQVSFTPTDGHGNAISYQTSNGQTIKSPVSCTVTAGAVASGCKVADTTLTTPLNLCYLTQVKNSATNQIVWGPFACVQPSGATYNLNSYQPTTAPYPLAQPPIFPGVQSNGSLGLVMPTLGDPNATPPKTLYLFDILMPLQGVHIAGGDGLQVNSGDTQVNSGHFAVNGTDATFNAPVTVNSPTTTHGNVTVNGNLTASTIAGPQNTLDDGGGNAQVQGTLTVGAAACSGTAPANAICVYGQWWTFPPAPVGGFVDNGTLSNAVVADALGHRVVWQTQGVLTAVRLRSKGKAWANCTSSPIVQVLDQSGSVLATFNEGSSGPSYWQSDGQSMSAAIAAPANATLTGAASGGYVGAGTYAAEVTFVDRWGRETAASPASSSVTTTGTTSSLSCSAPTLPAWVAGFKCYVQTNGGSFVLQGGLPTTSAIAINQTPSTSGTTPPSSGTAQTDGIVVSADYMTAAYTSPAGCTQYGDNVAVELSVIQESHP